MKSKGSRVKLQSYHGLLGDLNLSPPQYSPPPRSIHMAGYGEGGGLHEIMPKQYPLQSPMPSKCSKNASYDDGDDDGADDDTAS